MRRESAEIVALRALAWVADDPEMLGHFLNATGARAGELRARAEEPEFLGHVLDFVLLDDAWVMAFCDANGLGYREPAEARVALPGGAETSWT